MIYDKKKHINEKVFDKQPNLRLKNSRISLYTDWFAQDIQGLKTTIFEKHYQFETNMWLILSN